MSFEPPDGILDIGNATLRVGKLEVAETSGLNQGLLNIVKNNILINENIEYPSSNTWGIKLPTTWVAEFDVKGHSTTKYVEFNFYNEDKTSNALGYLLNFKDTTLSLMYDTSLDDDQNILATATIPTIVGAYRKVNIFFERGVISVSIDGTRYLYHKETDGFNQNLGVASRVVSATGSAFVNVFIEQDASNSKFKNLRIVNGRFISDKTSNIAFIGGNLGVGVNSPKESLDILGNMHLTRVSNVSQISVDSNVVTEYTGPHDRPLRKYPEVALTSASDSGYVTSSSTTVGTYYTWKAFDNNLADDSSVWTTVDNIYDSNDDYAYNSNKSLGGVDGEWLKIKLPNKIKPSYARIYPRTYSPPIGNNQSPEDFKILASNDDSNWVELTSVVGWVTNATWGRWDISSETPYKYFAIVCTRTIGAATFGLAELEFYGHEEGGGSLDTTLKTVYNVPATTGTQLEVYYDAKGETTMPNPVTDLAGGDQDGTVTGHSPTLDETNGIKSFKFDGVDDYIESTLTNDSGAWIFSKSLWFKQTTGVPGVNLSCMSSIGDYSVSDATFFYLNDTYILVSIYSSGAFFPVKWVVNEWTHAVVVMKGTTSSINDIELYINGKKVEAKSQFGTATTRTLPANAQLRVGREVGSGTSYFTGSIANFRLYSKALNAGQVKELYDYQKDYFLGSKSQVTLYKGHLGVGVTEPSGQLELAGDERLQEYPPGIMNINETLIPGHGVFKARSSTSSSLDDRNPWAAFNKSISGGWDSLDSGSDYSTSDGSYTSNQGNTLLSSGSNYSGEFLEIELPYPIKLRTNQFYPQQNTTYGTPRFFREALVLGSNNGHTWDTLQSISETSYSYTYASEEYLTVNTNSETYYKYFRVAVNKVIGGTNGNRININGWRLFGTPGPTTLDKGSLTLGRSLDVPHISRYDVDTETPRPEKLVVDFDTTVNSSPTDISGKGNHGSFYGTAQYSAVDKAFNFDGTNDYIEAVTNLGTGNQNVSFSMWINTHTVSRWFMWLGSEATAGGMGMYRGSSTYKIVVRSGGNVEISAGPLNTWEHLVFVYDSSTGAFKGYLNGEPGNVIGSFIDTVDVFNLASNPPIEIGARTTAGSDRYFDGQISNFKLYNVALEPSEVKKLYNLGRTGRSMVIGDTAVGIGKAPEAQLDVRGSIRATGSISSNNPSFSYWKINTAGIQATLETPSGTQKAGFFQNFMQSFGQNHENGYLNENINSMFDPDSGTFHVPERGLYQLTFNFTMVDSSSAGRGDETLHMSFQILNNGSYETRLTSTSAFQSFNPALTTGPSLEEYWCLSECVLLDTGANVRVYLQNIDSNNEFSITKMNFSGFKIA